MTSSESLLGLCDFFRRSRVLVLFLECVLVNHGRHHRSNNHQPYKLLLKLAQRIADLLVQAREDSLGLLDCLLLNMVVSILRTTINIVNLGAQFLSNIITYLLSQNELGILIICIFASFELSDLDILLLELLVVALFFFDQTVEHRGGDCELGWGWHCEVDLLFLIGGKIFGDLNGYMDWCFRITQGVCHIYSHSPT